MSKYNAKLIKYSPFTTKPTLWGAKGGPERNKGYISPVSEATARAARAAYSAAAAWSDEQLGRMPRPYTMILAVTRSC